MKRTLSLMLTICMVFTLFSGALVSGSANAITYSDVPDSFWAYKEIYYLTDKGILEGDGTGKFRPTDTVTHIEFIKMIVATFNLVDVASINYTNVPQWAKDGRYLEKAAAQGFLLNYSTNFDFTNELTREEAVALVIRYLGLEDGISASSSQFTDYLQISSSYRDYVLKAVGSGIIYGYEDKTFQPARTLSRSEALAILYRAAGAIFTASASSVEASAPKNNATINRSLTLTGITLTGSIYITEGVDLVSFDDCYISGTLYVRGDTEVTFEDCTVSNVTVNGAGAKINVAGDTTVNNANINARTTVNVEEDALVKKLLFNNGSKNSTLAGKGAVTNIAVQDDGITSTGVVITEYYIYAGYKATFDGIEYSAGTGKPVKSGFSSATVAGNTSSSSTSTIFFSYTPSVTGTVYAAAWPKNQTSLTASEIKALSSSYNSTSYGTYKNATANTSSSISLTVAGTYTNYNVGLIVVPSGVSGTTGVVPVYNKSVLTSTYTAMTTDVPSATVSDIPAWTLTTSGNALVVTFDQIVYYKSGTSYTKLSDLSYNSLKSLFTLNIGSSSSSTDFNISCTDTSTYTVIYITPIQSNGTNLGIVNGTTYRITMSSSVTSAKGYSPNNITATVVAGATASDIPTWTLTTSGNTLIVTFNQLVYYNSSLLSSTSVSNQTLSNLFNVYGPGNTAITNYTISATSTSTATTVQITPAAGLIYGQTYKVYLSTSIVSAKNYAPSVTDASVVAGYASNLSAPEIFLQTGEYFVTAGSRIYITIPVGADRVFYSYSVNNGSSTTGTLTGNASTSQYFSLPTNLTSSVASVSVSAYAVNSSGARIGDIATTTFYANLTPVIYVDGYPYTGTNNVVSVVGNYTISAEIIGSSSSSYTLTLFMGSSIISSNGTTHYYTDGDKTFTANVYYQNQIIATASVTVKTGSGQSQGSDLMPTVVLNNNNLYPEGYYDTGLSKPTLSVYIPNITGHSYFYEVIDTSVTNGTVIASGSLSTNGNSVGVDFTGTSGTSYVSRTLRIYVVSGSSTVANFYYYITYRK